MPRRRTAKFKLPGFRKWLDNVSEETARAGAKEIVTDLKTAGPYYTGHFEESWEVKGGDVRIPADSEHPLGARERWQGWDDNTFPLPRRISPVDIPQGFTQFTIGNRSKYRDVALDLVPGRVEPGKNNTAPKDWFVRYAQGGGLSKALERATGIASKSPRSRASTAPAEARFARTNWFEQIRRHALGGKSAKTPRTSPRKTRFFRSGRRASIRQTVFLQIDDASPRRDSGGSDFHEGPRWPRRERFSRESGALGRAVLGPQEGAFFTSAPANWSPVSLGSDLNEPLGSAQEGDFHERPIGPREGAIFTTEAPRQTGLQARAR